MSKEEIIKQLEECIHNSHKNWDDYESWFYQLAKDVYIWLDENVIKPRDEEIYKQQDEIERLQNELKVIKRINKIITA